MRVKSCRRTSLATSLALLLALPLSAFADGPTLDLGSTDPSQVVNVTLVLKLHNADALEQYVYQSVTPGNPRYHRFLSTAQFAQGYGASPQEIAQVQTFLKRYGISQTTVLPNHLVIKATGTIGQFNQAFQTSVDNYQDKRGHRFHRPRHRPVFPTALGDTLVVAAGLNSEAQYLPHHLSTANVQPLKTLAPSLSAAPSNTQGGNGTATGIPGEYTVGDVANFYDINPLYKAGITGKGSTLGIVTLAGFDSNDAYQYWSQIGLATKPNRITQVHVDGGGVISSDAGSGETALDVEQSGGLAPQADVLVYDAPNTSGGFIGAFYQAVSDNRADSLSVSWGSPEVFYFNSPLTDGDYTAELQAFHQVFLEAAAQGISLFAASGDSGAYDTVRALGHDLFSAPLTVDAPASDPFITAAGGTTRPFSFSFRTGPVASITQESVWGWDYIQNYFEQNELGALDLFSTGGGGGVSVYWPAPLYQQLTRGILSSESNQSLVDNDPSQTLDGYTQTTPLTLLKLPARYRGRNVPDVSLNADPETGYLYYSTPDGGLLAGEGGTSFVAPQLNGISALLTQSSGHRVGFWNPQLYALQTVLGYGRYSAFNQVSAGDNWFYQGKSGYEPGAGIGTLDVANLALLLKSF